MPHNDTQSVRPVAAAIVLLPVLSPCPGLAAGQADKAGGSGVAIDYMSSGYLVEMILGLVFVLMCIVVLAWFARRFRHLQSSADGSMQVLGGISMGARERVVLLQVGSARLLLGVAPGRINTLHVLDRAQDKDDAGPGEGLLEAGQANFAGNLGSALARGGRER